MAAHIIQRKIMDIETRTQRDADMVLDEYGAIWAQKLEPVEARIFAAFSDDRNPIIVDRLELDLGEVSRDIDEKDFEILYENALHKALKDFQDKQIYEHQDETTAEPELNAQNSGTSNHFTLPVLYFLEHGRLPWWCEERILAHGTINDNSSKPSKTQNLTALNALEQELNEALNSQVEKIITWYKALSPQAASSAVQRCLYQFGHSTLQALSKKIIPNQTLQNLEEAFELFEDISIAHKRSDIEAKLYEKIWAGTTQETEENSLAEHFGAIFRQEIPLQELQKIMQKNQLSEFQNRLVQHLVDATKHEAETRLSTQDAVDKDNESKLLEKQNVASAQSSPQQRDTINEQIASHENFNQKQEEGFSITSFEDARKIMEQQNFTSKNAPTSELITDSKPGTPSANFQETQQDVDNTENNSQTQTLTHNETIFVSNAGVILLHPYLHHFFKALGYQDEEGWIDDNAPQNAALALQYLITKEERFPEYSLMLNKVLCGLPLETPMPVSIPITNTLKEESQNLLTAVTQHWTMLGNTSPDGLRSTFLMRDGILERREKGWRLRIEKGPYDVLLDGLPWGYRIVRLSWMKEALEVEW